VYIGHRLHLLPRPHRHGALPAHCPPDWMEAHGGPVLLGRGCHLGRGLSHLGAFPLVQRAGLAFPEPQHALANQRPPLLYRAVAIGSRTTRLHHLPAHLPVLPSSRPHHALLPAHLPAPEEEEGHGGPRPEHHSEEEQRRREDQRHVIRHRGGIRTLLAPSQRLQHGV